MEKIPWRIYGASPSAAGPLDSLVAQWFGGFVAKLLSGSGKGERVVGGSLEGGNNKINKLTVRFLFCVCDCLLVCFAVLCCVGVWVGFCCACFVCFCLCCVCSFVCVLVVCLFVCYLFVFRFIFFCFFVSSIIRNSLGA